MTYRYDGSDIDADALFYIEGETIKGLLSIAALLSSGDRVDADKRRDMAQWMQARLIRSIPVEK